MNEMLSVLVMVGGGLGTFLLGMKHLSEGLQAVSGSGLRKFMSIATTHRLAGIGTGIVSTTIVQSSSIITVMTVGFVSSGLMNLTQAINVIVGSNIGTTTTAWLIAFAPDVKVLGLFTVLVGSALYFFQNRERLHDLGLALMGLGFIFMGLYWMKEGMEPVRELPAVVEAFKSLDATSAWGLAKCVFVSLAFTAVVQSSAATTAIAMTLAQQGLLSFEAAAATVFGMNIGTTVTAWLAAFNGSAEARQTALAHTLFNVVGTIVIIPFFVPAILPLATSLFPNYAEAVVADGVTTYPNIAAPMAAVHTLFNLITTALFLPFVKQFANLVARLIRADAREKPHLSALTAPPPSWRGAGSRSRTCSFSAAPRRAAPATGRRGPSPRRRRRRVEDVRRDEVDYLPENGIYCLRCFGWGCFHNPVGYRKSPPDATLNFHSFANAVNEWDANEGK